MTELTRKLAAHIAGTGFSALTPRAVLMAKCSLLDALGVSLAASGLEPACRPFAELAAQSCGPCTILGSGRRTLPLLAALANGALAHALDYEDTFDAAPAHPNAACVPVLLALLEREPALSGRQLVVALALGSDLVCRLALALRANPDEYGFYTPAILGSFGAAAAAAKLLALDEDQIVSALALTLSQATCSSQWKRDPDSPLRAVRDAFSAQAALTAGLLAAEGVRGFEGAIDGVHGLYALYARGAYDPDALCAGLGNTFHGEAVSFKPWPSCRGTHSFIEAALALRQRLALRPAEIERIEAHGAALNVMLAEPEAQKQRPRTAIDAKFSLPFCVGLALVRGEPSLDDFGPTRLADPAVLDVAQRLVYRVDPSGERFAATSGRLVLHVRGGERHVLHVEHALGHPSNPLGVPRLIDKFVACAARAARPLAAAEARELADTILAIDSAASARAALRGLLGSPT